MKRTILLCLALLLVLGGCNKQPEVTYDGTFDDYVHSLFVEVFEPTDISINLLLNDPEAYGIEPEPYELGFATQEDYDASEDDVAMIILTLKSFADDQLTAQEILDRNGLIAYFETLVARNKFYEFEEGSSLSSSRSYIMSLPSYLDVYAYQSEQDITYYYHFVETLSTFFDQYVELEKTRQSNGTGLSQAELDDIIEAAKSTAEAASKEDYFLNKTFDDNLAAMDFLDASQKEDYSASHRALMLEVFAQAYTKLANDLSEIEGGDLTGLANKTNGKAYYEYLFAKNTASSYTVSQVQDLLEDRMETIFSRLMTHFMSTEDDQIESKFQNGNIFEGLFTDEKSVLDEMVSAMQSDFPIITIPNYEIKIVDESLRESASPAFYFTPKVDTTDANTQYIYVNGDFDNKWFTTYVHEGIPGHLYQFNYFNQSGQNDIRNILTLSANAEGWANYAENYATKYVLGDDLGAFFADYFEFYNMLYINLDIGINYDGWSQQYTLDYLKGNGWMGQDATLEDVDELFKAFVENPCVYPMYYISSMYYRILSEKAAEVWGSDYSDYKFHQQVLDLGSTSFDDIESALGLKIID